MPLEQVRFESLGSSCHLLGVDLEPGRLSWAVAWVASMHDRFSRFLSDSELCQFNARAGAWTPVSSELEAMLRAALEAHQSSGGLVHVGVLSSMLAIGYTRPLSEGPTQAILAAAGPPPALHEMLEVEPGRARLRRGTGVDLGGLAKGWLADRLVEQLGANCLANLGGDLSARGDGPDGEGWPVGLAGVSLLLRDQGAATSGTGRRRWDEDGEGLHHLIDPRSGRPATTDVREVSAVAETAAEAEVVVKTALLLGSDDAPVYLTAYALAWYLLPRSSADLLPRSGGRSAGEGRGGPGLDAQTGGPHRASPPPASPRSLLRGGG